MRTATLNMRGYDVIADVNVKNKDGWSALIWAASKGHKETVELLKKAAAKE